MAIHELHRDGLHSEALRPADRRADIGPVTQVRVDLAPEIHRQRLVIEGNVTRRITAPAIQRYLTGLSHVTDMVPLMTPVTHRSDLYGWAGWIHWETSGAHFYAWDQPRRFFSVDMYTCKAFDPKDAVDYTVEFFEPTETTWFGF